MITASWNDVKQKAYGIISQGRVDIYDVNTYSILASVHGYHDIYECYVNNKARVTKDNDIDKANWYCTCDWGGWSNSGNRPHDGADSYGSVKSNNRMCSHAYACYILLQTYRRHYKDFQ